MSFGSTPVTRTLVLGLVGSSITASLFDIKHYFYISVGTHILQYRQTWRALIWQLCYTNSSEVLFAAMILYNLRVVEQQWGSRKYAVRHVVSLIFFKGWCCSHKISRSSSSRGFSPPSSRQFS